MADEADIANDYWEQHLKQYIEQTRQSTDYGTIHCIECGEEINPERRKKVNTSLCIECKEEEEFRRRTQGY